MDWLLTYWLEAGFGVAVAAIGAAYRRLATRMKRQDEQRRTEQQAIKLGIQALLKDRLLQSYDYHMDKGFCPIPARENIANLYAQYHALGGNGTVTELVDRVNGLGTGPDF